MLIIKYLVLSITRPQCKLLQHNNDRNKGKKKKIQVVLNDIVVLACEKRRPVTTTEFRNYINWNRISLRKLVDSNKLR